MKYLKKYQNFEIPQQELLGMFENVKHKTPTESSVGNEILGYVTLKGGRIAKAYPVGEWDQDWENNLEQKIKSGNAPFDSWKWVTDEIFFRPESIGKTIEEIERDTKVDISKFGKFNPELKVSPHVLSSSKVGEKVFRIGEIVPNPKQGGIWFSQTKEGSENFMISVYRKKLEAKAYHIILKNPYPIEKFWSDYINKIRWEYGGSREAFQKKLIEQGYDGMIIAESTWNDTDDEYSVKSEQYVVFDPSNVYLA